MSYGEGDLHARVGELERELSEAQGMVEDFACENVELRERVEEMESLVRDMLPYIEEVEGYKADNFRDRAKALHVAVEQWKGANE